MDNSQTDDIGFLDMLNGGSGEVNWSGTQYSSPISEQEKMSTPDVSVVSASAFAKSKQKKAKTPSTKGKTWSSDEDKVLIAAWGNTSLDAVTGTHQNSSCYWNRILDYYNLHKDPSWPERNYNAVNCRFTVISAATSKFCGCLQQILNLNESGRTLNQKQTDAELLYMSLDPEKKPFKLMHCYVEFEKYPKWATCTVPQKKQKKTSDASPGSTSNDEDFVVCTDALENEKRPRGTKYAKEQRDKASDGSAVKLSLETVWVQKLEKDDIKEAAKSARYALAFELQKKQIELKETEDARQEREDARQEREDARKQFELEEKIMLTDTSGMNVARQEREGGFSLK
ncbi:glutathione S-transferase T3-like [Lolium perenne]|uniref:glutathione S-transferase T3-like n=1 Tax=Lolium perenne TaxID=4522 RepID=UPI0021F68617|nr:glutathione S-transferase T3-like [Lolium perenne]